MSRRPRFVHNNRYRGCRFYLCCPVRIVVWIYGLRTPHLPGLPGTNGFCRHWTSNCPLFAHISLHVFEQVGGQPVSSLQILPNPPLVPSDVVQHSSPVIPGCTVFKPQFHFFPAAQQMCRLRVDQQLVDLSHLREHWVRKIR